jgi:hypothetical protein
LGQNLLLSRFSPVVVLERLVAAAHATLNMATA